MAVPRMSPKPEPASKSIVRLVVTNWIIGAALGVLCAALLLWLDVAGLRGLMFREASTMTVGLALLFGGFAVTFGSVVCGSAIMAVAVRKEGRDDNGGTRVPAGIALSPVALRHGGRAKQRDC